MRDILPAVFYAQGMTKKKRRDLATDEPHMLAHCQLRRLTGPADIARCAQALREHQYRHNVTLVGKHLR